MGAWTANGRRPATSTIGRIVAAAIALTPTVVQRRTLRPATRSRRVSATGIRAAAWRALVRSLAGPSQDHGLGSPLKGRAKPKNRIRHTPLTRPAAPLIAAQFAGPKRPGAPVARTVDRPAIGPGHPWLEDESEHGVVGGDPSQVALFRIAPASAENVERLPPGRGGQVGAEHGRSLRGGSSSAVTRRAHPRRRSRARPPAARRLRGQSLSPSVQGDEEAVRLDLEKLDRNEPWDAASPAGNLEDPGVVDLGTEVVRRRPGRVCSPRAAPTDCSCIDARSPTCRAQPGEAPSCACRSAHRRVVPGSSGGGGWHPGRRRAVGGQSGCAPAWWAFMRWDRCPGRDGDPRCDAACGRRHLGSG